MTTIKREDTATGTITVFTDMSDAVQQFIVDSAYVAGMSIADISEYTDDMVTVNETVDALNKLEKENTLEAGAFIYSK